MSNLIVSFYTYQNVSVHNGITSSAHNQFSPGHFLSTFLYAPHIYTMGAHHFLRKQRTLCLDELVEGTVDRRPDWLDILPEVDRLLTTGSDTFRREVEFLQSLLASSCAL
jgi:hypothetical protein